MNSPDHSTKGTPSGYRRKRQCLPFDCLWVLGFRDSFIPLAGCFSPFPHGTRALSVANRIEPWRVVPPASHRISRVPWYSGVRSPDHVRVGYGPLTLSGACFPAASPTHMLVQVNDRSLQPHIPVAQDGFGLLPFRSPLLRESRLISLPPGTEMFQFPRCPSSGL